MGLLDSLAGLGKQGAACSIDTSTPVVMTAMAAPTRVRPGARRRNHRHEQLNILKQWFDEHASDPYPSPEEKVDLAEAVGMEIKQIEHWFTNQRKRHWDKQQRPHY